MTRDRDEALVRPNRPLGPVREHFWKVQRMAQATGVDLAASMEGDALSQEDWAEMVARCRSCAWTEGCGRWLAQGDEAGRDCPEACRNQQSFDLLKAVAAE
ncbi:DUF6455 family protein [Pacificoceanicola onchidii]|uniref:DUF6455 family protein n=1 Tax=Pacificoceanicola onchidii TaxID=2562685 RepID=UPI0010A2F52C|nr:DUF6455 family protein [Pacificoceanicola onchidii]